MKTTSMDILRSYLGQFAVQIRKTTLPLLQATVLFCIASNSQAGEVPNISKKVDLNTREQEFTEFVDALFQSIDVPIIMGEGIEGTINGRFSGSAKDIIDEVAGAFNVVFYHDGAVAYIYNTNQLTKRLIPAARPDVMRVLKLVSDLQLQDKYSLVRAAETGLLASGTPRFLEQIEELLYSVENQPKPVTAKRPISKPVASVVEEQPGVPIYKVYKLRHAWASDTNFRIGNNDVSVPGVATILKDLITKDAVSTYVVQSGATSSRGSLEGLRGQGINAVNRDEQNRTDNSTRTFGGASTDDIIRIVADTRLNAVIVRDLPERMSAYDNLIASLDVESQMVEIEATIIDINTDKARELGVNWRYSSDDVDVLIGSGTGSDLNLLPGSNVATPVGQGGVLSLMLGEPSNFIARIRALEEQGAARIISKPHVITLSDVEAVLGASTEFFVRVEGNEEVDLFNVPVGTFLRVTPHVFSDNRGNRIKLLVNIEDGTQANNKTVDNIPVIERANINTQAVINEGDSLLIGGLVREAYTKSEYRVPLLGGIPVLGRLFRSSRSNATRIERLFMITPRVAKDNGFVASKVQPMLEGTVQNIVDSASKRIEGIRYPETAEQAYWPDQAGLIESTNDASSNMSSRKNSNVVDGEVVRLDAVSRFTVVAWPVSE